jgi:hypothetical protein
LPFEALERSVDGGHRHLAAGARQNFLADGDAVGSLAKAGHRQQDQDFEVIRLAVRHGLNFFLKQED